MLLLPGKARKMLEVVSPMHAPFPLCQHFPSSADLMQSHKSQFKIGFGVCFNDHLVWPDRFRRCSPSGLIFKQLQNISCMGGRAFVLSLIYHHGPTFNFAFLEIILGWERHNCISSHNTSVKCHHFSLQTDGALTCTTTKWWCFAPYQVIHRDFFPLYRISD